MTDSEERSYLNTSRRGFFAGSMGMSLGLTKPEFATPQMRDQHETIASGKRTE
jgi:hypothetical protein